MSNFLWKVLTFSVGMTRYAPNWQQIHAKNRGTCSLHRNNKLGKKLKKNTEPLLKFSRDPLLYCWVVTITWIKKIHFIQSNTLEVYYIYLTTSPKFFKKLLAYIYSKCKALLLWDKMFHDFTTIEYTGSLTCYP